MDGRSASSAIEIEIAENGRFRGRIGSDGDSAWGEREARDFGGLMWFEVNIDAKDRDELRDDGDAVAAMLFERDDRAANRCVLAANNRAG
jgi:hypothetical protein